VASSSTCFRPNLEETPWACSPDDVVCVVEMFLDVLTLVRSDFRRPNRKNVLEFAFLNWAPLSARGLVAPERAAAKFEFDLSLLISKALVIEIEAECHVI